MSAHAHGARYAVIISHADLEAGFSFGQVKARLASSTGISARFQRLICKGKEVRDTGTVADALGGVARAKQLKRAVPVALIFTYAHHKGEEGLRWPVGKYYCKCRKCFITIISPSTDDFYLIFFTMHCRVERTADAVGKLEAEVQTLTSQLRHRAFGGDPAPLHTRLLEVKSTIEDLLGGLHGVSVKKGGARESREGLKVRLGTLLQAVEKAQRQVKL